MIFESEILTSWIPIVADGQAISVPSVSHRYGIHNWEDATGADKVVPGSLVVIRALTESPATEVLDAADPFCAVLWSEPRENAVKRRGMCERQQAEKLIATIDAITGKDVGRDVVGTDWADMALTVVGWRLKMWIRSLCD